LTEVTKIEKKGRNPAQRRKGGFCKGGADVSAMKDLVSKGETYPRR